MNKSRERNSATSESGLLTRQRPLKLAMAAATKTEVAQIGNPSVEVTPPPIINEVTLNMEILRMKQVSAHIGLGRSTIYAMLDPKSRSFVPSFPKPVRISNRSIGWPSQSITQYLIDREGA